jgi:transposase
MIAAPPAVRVYLACGTADMRRGMAGLAMQVQQVLSQNPLDGAVFAFRGRRWWSDQAFLARRHRTVPADKAS